MNVFSKLYYLIVFSFFYDENKTNYDENKTNYDEIKTKKTHYDENKQNKQNIFYILYTNIQKKTIRYK